MSIRIYALAQQLKVETKKLVDTLKQLGIEGKGSALASLTDEEVELVKAAFQKNTEKAAKPGSAFAETPFQRPTTAGTGKKVPVLAPSRNKKEEQSPDQDTAAEKEETAVLSNEKKSSAATGAAAGEKTDSVGEKPDATDKSSAVPSSPEPTPVQTVPQKPTLPPPIGRVDLSSTMGTKKTSPLGAFRKKMETESDGAEAENPEQPAVPPSPITTGLSEPGHAAAIRREDYRSPMRVITDKIPNLDARRQKNEKDKASGAAKPSGPSIRLAPVPKTPTAKTPKSKEPAPQKPDMKLPPEVIRDAASTGSSKPLEDHIRKHDEKQRLKEEERRAREARKGKGKTGQAAVPDDLLVGKGAKKRGPLEPGTPLEEARKKRRGPSRRNRNEFEEGEMAVTPRQLRRQRVRGRSVNTAAPRKTDIVIQLPCTVKQFAEQTGLSLAVIIKKLMELGTPMVMNSQLDRDSSELLAAEFDLAVTIRDQVTLEDRLVTAMFEQEDPPETLQPRPPVVTVLGHVDHGKTTLLDRILNLNVVSGEKGGITQHIRAYRVEMPGGDITFVDTPGHEAFTEMRARGANCTDIVVLVVAVDDGVMPQTEEAISHAKAAGVPIIVALNKTDIPGVNIDKVVNELASHELTPAEWGGETEMVRCSALTGEGVDKLLETIQIVAEVHELKANPDRAALGVALEAELQSGQGVVCKALVQKGTLRTGDVVLCGTAYGRVRVLYDTLDTKRQINEAGPSTPVNLIGLDVAPSAGSLFCVLDDISDARTIAEQRLKEEHKNELADLQPHVTLETLFQRINSQEVRTLNIIIRADVRGSIEAIRKELGKLEHPEVKIKILQATVGGVTEADVQLADASDAIIVAFNVVADENARVMAEKKKVQVRRYDIIYNLTDDIKKALEGMLKPLEQVKELGRALVQKVYTISRVGSIAGCRVIGGTIERDCRIRVIRESRIIGDYGLDSLKREKDDVKEIRDGYECGMKLKGFNDLKEGDILEAYKIEEIARTF